MKKVIRLTESDLTRIVQRVISESEPFTFGDKVRDTLGPLVGISRTSESEKVLARKILDKVESGEYEKVGDTDGIVGRGKTIKVNLEDGEYIVSPRKERVALSNSFITSTMVKTPSGDRFMIPGKGFAKKLMELIKRVIKENEGENMIRIPKNYRGVRMELGKISTPEEIMDAYNTTVEEGTPLVSYSDGVFYNEEDMDIPVDVVLDELNYAITGGEEDEDMDGFM